MRMNWLGKVRFLISEQNKPDYCKSGYFIDVSFRKNNWASEELNHLKTHYPNLHQSYVEFIQEFDSVSISGIVFYGSEKTNIIPLIPEIVYWREEGLSEDYFPFGKGPAGEVYVFDHRGAVIEFPCDDYEFEKPEKIASSLEEFVDYDLLGERYRKRNGIEKNSFYDFMKLQDWV